MRTSQAIFVALGALLQCLPEIRASSQQCVLDPNAVVTDACTTYSSLDHLNDELRPHLEDVTQNTDFFSYYRLNLYNKVCPFWNDESSMCGNRACAVDTIDDQKDIPQIWRAEELSKLEGMRAKHPGRNEQRQRPKARPLQFQLGENVDESCVLEDDDECDERDYCVPEDEGASAKGDYVSLLNNTERFTGYSGPGARQVWDAIYKENCFSRPTTNLIPGSGRAPGPFEAASALQSVIQHSPFEVSDATLEDSCLEQRAFYRIISGMHTSISSHLCWDYLNQRTGEWSPNVTCYRERLHPYPERILNLYFNYALVTRAVAKLTKHLEHYTFCSGDPDQDYETKHKVLALASRVANEPNTFDESVMFTTPELLDLKDSFKQRFRNVSRIMDCVGCDKCRLWGKVQTAGYGAALKVLFEFDETKNGENPQLRRTELVALINTWGRISHSLDVIGKFRETVNEEEETDEKVEKGNWNKWVEMPTFGNAPTPAGFQNAKVTDEPAANHERQAASSPPEFAQDPKPGMINDPADFDDLDEEDLEDFNTQHLRPQFQSKGIWADIKDECDLVWRAYKLVLSSWVELPFKLSGIAVMELNRLWNFWVGLPVPERSWELDWSAGVGELRRDEL